MQGLAAQWVTERLGRACLLNRYERALRVLEEATELAQAEGVYQDDARRVVDYVFNRPVGEPKLEAAGTAVALLAWAEAADNNLRSLIETELHRLTDITAAQVQAKHAIKVDARVACRRVP